MATVHAASSAAAGLTAAYAFDEGAGGITADHSGNNLTGTLSNAPAWAAGKYGGALSFNASDDGNDSNDPRVVIGPNLKIPNPPFTVSVWVNPAGFADWRAILSKRDSGSASNRRFDVGLAAGTGRVYVATGASLLTFLYPVPLNTWTHLAVVAEPGATKLYVNGNLQQTLGAFTLGADTLANTVIGGTGEGLNGDSDPFKGLLDDLRVHNVAQSQSEIQSDMNTPIGPIDTQSPIVSMTEPAAVSTVSGSAVTVSATAGDNVGVVGVQFKLDGADLGTEDAGAPYSIAWNSLAVSNGAHTLSAVARDAAGNVTTSAGVSVTVSNPATLVITQPASGATLNGTTVGVSYGATGNLTGVDHVHFVLDANPQVMDVTFDGSYTFANVPAGAHVLNGFLVTSGHVKIPGSDATLVSFTTTVADTIPPTVSITSPAASSTVSATVTIAATASDNTGVLGVRFRVGAVNLNPEDTSAPFTASFNTTNFANGAHILTAIARDAAGNQTTSAGVPVTVSNLSSNDPAVVGQWSPIVPMPLVAVHMTLMSDGNILAWDDHTTEGGSHVWNLAANTFTPATYSAVNLFCSAHTALSDGRVLVNGGHYASYVGIDDTVLFSPSTGTWSAVAPMEYARWYPTTITLPNGRVLTVSGAINCPDCRIQGFPDPGVALIPEVYDPEANSWAQLDAASKYLPLYPHLFVLPDGRVIVTTTHEDPFPSSVLDLNTQTWTTIDPVVTDGGSSVMYLPGKFMKSGAAINTAYPKTPANQSAHVLDMTNSPTTWRQIAPMAFQRTQHNLTLLPDGTVLVTGGGQNSDRYDEPAAVHEAELWSPVTETFTTMASMVTPRLYHSTAILLPDGRVAAAGGGRTGPPHLNAEIFSPPYLFKGPRPTIMSAPQTIEYATNFTVTTPNAADIALVSLIRLGSVTHSMNLDQRFVPLTFQAAGGGLTVQAPTSRNVAIPGHYLLFLVNTAGVPSVGSIVRFPSPADDAVPPTAPGSLVATAAIGSVGLTWTAATDNVGVAAYEIHRSPAAGFTPSASTQVGLIASTNFTDAGLAAGAYFYKVRARDEAGNTGPPSNEVNMTVVADTQAPTTPVGLTATVVSFFRIDLSWSAATDNVGVTGYHVRRSGVPIATTTIPAYSNSGLAPSTTYTYSVVAFDAAGNPSSPSDSVIAATPAAPPAAIGRMAAYAFDEGAGPTTMDFSGYEHTGTLTNLPTWTAGKYGSALSFSASDDGNDSNDPRVVLGPDVSIPDLPITVSVWVRPTSYSDWRAILSKRNGPSSVNRRFDMGLSASTGRVYVATGASFRAFVYGPPINTWTHLAVVAEAGGTQLYVNGALQETIASITLGTDTQANTVIGGTGEGPSGDNDPFKGLLDDLRINDRALSQAEIQADMSTSASSPITGVNTAPPAPAVLRVFPNPFRGATKIEALPGEEVAVFGVNGRLIRKWRAAGAAGTLGIRRLDWDGTDQRGRRLPAGIYFVKAGSRLARVALLR